MIDLRLRRTSISAPTRHLLNDPVCLLIVKAFDAFVRISFKIDDALLTCTG